MYSFNKSIRDEPALRESFDLLARQTFGISFAKWKTNGWWTDRYIPYTLAYNGKVVASVSVNRMDFMWHGVKNSRTHKTILAMGGGFEERVHRPMIK